MEKLVLSLVFAAKRLRRYFQAHPITVITDQPIKQVMSRPDAAGQLQKWSIILREHNITYRPRTSIKGQILVDFLNKIPSNALQASNNEAEYEALIVDLRITTQTGVKNIQANVDSKLVANQVLGTYVAKEDNMIKYLEIAKGLVSGFKTFSISQVPQSKNKKADTLSKIASTSFAHLSKQVLVEVLETKSITGKEVTTVIEEEGPTWMTELVNYLKEVKHPQSNGLVERANRILREGIKARLGEGNKNWVEELPHVLWAHRTMVKSSHGDTHFSLTYRTEAVIPAEIRMPTYRTTAVDVVNNDKELRLNLDLLDEHRELAAINEA
nr:reverse transcriptase domain-containing protein [Tanacetum cinerariifolium]